MSKNVQFVVDGEGHKTAVIVPIEDYEEMMEDLHMQQVAESNNHPRPRQAVILIHGIGEQRPMSTLRAFVNAFLEPDNYYSKPETLSSSYESSYEMRRIKLFRSEKERVNLDWPETDFYEYYWAHHMHGTLMSHVVGWLWRSMRTGAREWKNLSDRHYNERLKWMVPLVWVVAVIGLVTLAMVTTRPPEMIAKLSVRVAIVLALWKLLIAPLVRSVLVDVVGDAARYFDVAPQNVARRYDILRGGIDLLRKLHTEQDEQDGKVMYRYHRIVLIGHSLGSVIGYDILRHYWSEVNSRIAVNVSDLEPVETSGTAAYDDPETYRHYQHEAWKSLNARWFGQSHVEAKSAPVRWLVTDFVTLGSPLTYATLLIADGLCGLKERIRLRELPTCPPDPSHRLNPGHFTVKLSAEADRFTDYWILHHAALLAVTRWINIYFSNDIVGGPLRNVFGPGIDDVAAKADRSVCWAGTAHVSYWDRQRSAAKPSLAKLQSILKWQ